MLVSLFGNKNVENILLFLFVHGKCYGAQLQKALKCPLTPIQNAFNRLENGGIIVSFYEGKTRLYQLNPSYPLLPELEQLMKKTYSLLPPQEKKAFNYYFQNSQNNKLLHAVWERLLQVKSLSFSAKTKSVGSGGWSNRGTGEVAVSVLKDDVIIFHEKGSWKDKSGQEIDFSNVFRWSLDRASNMISLEHLRHGFDHPVFLFHLVPAQKQWLTSVDSHLCGEDSYLGQVFCDKTILRLKWRVIGPKKNEEIDTYYA